MRRSSTAPHRLITWLVISSDRESSPCLLSCVTTTTIIVIQSKKNSA